MILRDYQAEAINACAWSLKKETRSLIVAATGSGKSVIIAGIVKRLIEKHPGWRVLVLCYVQEILLSNADACEALGIACGVYCAGAGRKDTMQNVIHASRDSLGVKPEKCGQFDVIILDEAHMLSADVDSRYQKIISILNPKYLIGLTATPFRLQGGHIYGKRKFFPAPCINISMSQLVKQGYLSPFVFPANAKKIVDASLVKKVKGEFDAAELDKLVNHEAIIEASFEQWEEHAEERNTTLFFCHSVAHGKLCYETFQKTFPQYSCAYLDGETNKREREIIIEMSKQGAYKAIFNVSVLTTGTNIPPIDCVTWLRPTASPVLWVQGSGRGSRLHSDKKNCLILDLVGNMERFQSIENPVFEATGGGKKQEFTDEELIDMGIEPSEMKGKAPTKDCPKCSALLNGAARKCDSCGHLFITLKSAYSMANGPGNTTHDIEKCGYQNSVTASGEACMIVTYVTTKGAKFKEWVLHTRHFNRDKWFAIKQVIDDELVSKITLIPTNNPKFPKVQIQCRD